MFGVKRNDFFRQNFYKVVFITKTVKLPIKTQKREIGLSFGLTQKEKEGYLIRPPLASHGTRIAEETKASSAGTCLLTAEKYQRRRQSSACKTARSSRT